MRYLIILILVSCFSCNNERVLQLPEIKNTDITEVLDVSPAYVFYDQTQPDSSLLNRKNLIISTNWLVNVDKRLTLKQAIPHIKFLQDKKRNAELHKNKDAKNYFTCNNTSIGSLGFVEFTDVYYQLSEPEVDTIDLLGIIPKHLGVKLNDSLSFTELSLKINQKNINTFQTEIISFLELIDNTTSISSELKITEIALNLCFEESLSFQDYIAVKSKLSKLESDKIKINSNEFIY
ncbi:hypothetical protein [Winogradskyella sp. UBA3174]|uniref:hypothetical protein n=1 Tax=Winogradskyella sp. UBA3174 TaxID=1947785 RepID=UPI0025E8E674|nr:hypothetical protein [Winogradskyella sp. UBA3174]|tara:strand:+ start:7392 stop:8096 length:705 start_codon:yes stop_codon:yes gene_type:complete